MKIEYDGKKQSFDDLFVLSVPGGGRIRHDGKGSVFVYGYSVGFGTPDHCVAMQILEWAYPKYPIEGFTYSYDGYWLNFAL